MRRLHGVTLRPAPVARARIELALTSSARGKALLAGNKLADSFNQAPGDEAYLLDVNGQRAALVPGLPRVALRRADIVAVGARRQGRKHSAQVEGARVVDYPQLGFRGVHICIFRTPNWKVFGRQSWWRPVQVQRHRD
jgi:hypothetical protein